jgi:hypothetical protein
MQPFASLTAGLGAETDRAPASSVDGAGVGSLGREG